MSRPAAVIVLAAGQGTRMKSTLPKVVHPLSGLSMIGHALRAAHGLDPQYLVAVVRHQRDVVAAEIERVATHEAAGHAVTVLTSRVEDPTGYGRIIRDASGTVTAIVEQRDATPEQAAINEINAGIYAFDADFLRASLASLGTDNDQGEVYLTDVLAAAAPAGRTAGALELTDHWQSAGANDRVQLAELGAEMNRRICEAHMRAGVTIVDPASTWIDVDVRVGADTTIYPGTCLRGTTVVGADCEIGPSATLIDAEIGDRSVVPTAWIGQGCVAADTMVAPYCTIGTLIAAPRA